MGWPPRVSRSTMQEVLTSSSDGALHLRPTVVRIAENQEVSPDESLRRRAWNATRELQPWVVRQSVGRKTNRTGSADEVIRRQVTVDGVAVDCVAVDRATVSAASLPRALAIRESNIRLARNLVSMDSWLFDRRDLARSPRFGRSSHVVPAKVDQHSRRLRSIVGRFREVFEPRWSFHTRAVAKKRRRIVREPVDPLKVDGSSLATSNTSDTFPSSCSS